MTLLFQGLTRGRVRGCNIDDLLPTADVSYVKDKSIEQVDLASTLLIQPRIAFSCKQL